MPTVTVNLTHDQYNLARRRAFVEDLGWQPIFRALINAYIAGDITVTKQGRYSVLPPKSAIPVVHIPKGDDVIEVEPEWNMVGDPRPQVGPDPNQHARPHSGWGTKHLYEFVQRETGRRIPRQYLRRLLNLLKIEKADNGRWEFTGPADPRLDTILEAIEDGTYDYMIQRGLETIPKPLKEIQKEINEAEADHDKAKRLRLAKRLAQSEE